MTRDDFNRASVIHGKIRLYENILELLEKGNAVVAITTPIDTMILNSEDCLQPSKDALIFLYKNLLEQALVEMAAI